MSLLLFQYSKKLDGSLFRQVIVRNLINNTIANLNVEKFITNFKNHLDSIRETIDEDIKDEVCWYLQGRIHEARDFFDMIIPEDAIPTHYSPSNTSDSSSDSSTGEAEASEGGPAEVANEPSPQPDEPTPTTSHSFDFEKFKNDIIRTLLALTNQPQPVNDPSGESWTIFRVQTLYTTAVCFKINRRIYGHWFRQ